MMVGQLFRALEVVMSILPLLYSTHDGGLHWDFANIPNDFVPSSITNVNSTIFISGEKDYY